MTPAVLAVDLGGTKIAAARVSVEGEISHRCQLATPAAGGVAVVEAIAALLDQMPQEGVGGIGIGVPGLARRDGSVWAPNIPGWEEMPLAERLGEQFSGPILVESDRNAFILGEAWKGAARGCRDAILLILGTGIGAGILSDGRLLRGHADLAGAAGWMALREEFLPEYAQTGCAEAHIAGPGLAREASRRLARPVDTRELIRLGLAGNETALELWRKAGHRLGLLLGNLVSILNPEVIVLGGGLGTASGMEELLLAPARATLRRWAQPLAAGQVRIEISQLGADAGLLGAARLAASAAGLAF